MIRGLSKSLIAATAQINQKSREAFVAEQKGLHEKMQAKAMKMPKQPEPKADPAAHAGAAGMANKNVKEEAGGTAPRTEKEKKLAAMRPPADKITHADVLHGRGVRKEAWEDMLKAVQKRREQQGTGKFDKKETGTGTAYTRKASTFDSGGKDQDMKKADKKMKQEEADQMSRAAKGHEKYGKEGMQALSKAGKEGKSLDPVRKKYDKYEEAVNMDTPGNSTHQCAIHVKSEQFGEGKTLFSQHARPDTEGHIAWYDVMFDEGIKRVKTEDLEILVSEAHMNHKKKKM
jgi:hypothetical protein